MKCKNRRGRKGLTGSKATIRSLRLPKKIKILNYIISIALIPQELLDAISEGIEAAWVSEKSTIFIRKELKPAQRRIGFLHELQHALVDIMDWERDG